jgi:hypothetical protein
MQTPDGKTARLPGAAHTRCDPVCAHAMVDGEEAAVSSASPGTPSGAPEAGSEALGPSHPTSGAAEENTDAPVASPSTSTGRAAPRAASASGGERPTTPRREWAEKGAQERALEADGSAVRHLPTRVEGERATHAPCMRHNACTI